MTRLSCRVATRALSLRFCRENFNSGDFFLAIFSPVASQVRGWLYVRFSSRAGDATKFEKIASPARAKNRSCGRGLRKRLNGRKSARFIKICDSDAVEDWPEHIKKFTYSLFKGKQGYGRTG